MKTHDKLSSTTSANDNLMFIHHLLYTLGIQFISMTQVRIYVCYNEWI